MRVKIAEGVMLAQCTQCKSVKIETDNKYCKFVYQKTIVEFNHLKKEICHVCKQANRVQEEQKG